MSGHAFLDPYVLDVSAASGSVTLDSTASATLIVQASENTSTAFFPASAALDGRRNTCWETNTVTSATTSITLRNPTTTPFEVVDYTLVARDGWGDRAPADFKLEGSDDLSSWTEVDSRTGITTWNNGSGSTNVKTFTLSTPAIFTYWKLTVTQTKVPGDIVNLGEMYFNGLTNANGTVFYVRMDGIEDFHHYQLTQTNGTGTLTATWGQWTAYSTMYVEQEEMGFYSPFAPTDPFFHSEGATIVKVALTSPGTFDFAWAKGASEPPRPYDWWSADALTPVAGGTIEYDNVGADFSSERHYTLTPTTTDVVTMSIDEPNGYVEVYRETGVQGWDEFTDWWEEDHPLAFAPIVGETYHVVVYPNGSPDNTTEYTLTWSADEPDPPPYVVSNDDFDDAINLGVLVNGTHDYDNTGATEDSTALPGKRSIWYRFHVNVDSAVKFVATPSDTTDDRRPQVSLWTALGSQVAGFGGTQFSTYVDANLEYYLQVRFPLSNPVSGWEQDGLLTYTVVARPVDSYPSAPVTLPPGDASPGAGQSPQFGPLLEGGFGAERHWKIVVPFDGGLSMIVERTTPFIPVVTVKLPYEWDANGLRQMQRVSLETNIHNTLPRFLPYRDVGTTAIEPLTITVKAGQVIEVTAASFTGPAYFRWGMTTESTNVTGAIGPEYGKVLTQDGTLTPSNWTAAQRDEVNANVIGWPHNDWGTAYAPFKVGIKPGDTNLPVTSYGGGHGVKTLPVVPLHWEVMPEILTNNIAGLSPSSARSTSTEYTTAIQNNLNGYILSDHDGVIQNLTSSLRMVRHQAYVAHDGETEWKENGPDVWHPRTAMEIAMRKTLNDYGPVIARASFGAFDNIRAWTGGFEHNVLVDILRYRVVWDTPQRERYDVYRWMAGYGALRYTRAPFDPLNSYPGTPIITPEPLVINTYEVPAELTQEAWVTPDDIAAEGEVIETFVWPGETGGAITSTTPRKERDYPSSYGTLPWAADTVIEDVLGGAHPTVGTELFDSTYALVHSVYADGTWDFDALMAHHLADHGWTNDEAGTFSHSAFIGYEINGEIRTEVRRVYEGTYTVSKWVPSLAPIDPSQQVQPGAGYYINPNPNLDGQGDDVIVHFASAT